MQRYPTSKSGLALPIEEVGYESVPPKPRTTNNHHMYWQADWYRGDRRHFVFRNLVDHVVTMRINEHNGTDGLHDRFGPPKRPPTGLMIDVLDEYMALNGVIDCVKERKTNETYQILPEQWSQIRQGI